ncbi:MAG: calcium-binding protein, partial [Gallionella sp.]
MVYLVTNGGAGNDILNGGAGDDLIDGGAGNDVITDTVGLNKLIGGAGDDYINGHGWLEGGTGNDILIGGGIDAVTGSGDTYIFNVGDGQDSISDFGSPIISSTNVKDVVQFGVGITPTAISLSRNNTDLVFNIGQSDQLTIKNWFVNSGYQIEAFNFADGTIWDPIQIRSMMVSYNGTAAGDIISGWSTNDLIDGGAGNDMITDTFGLNKLIGGAGDDRITGHGTLAGGTGNDTLIGAGMDAVTGSGDTYVFNVGDGQDSISDFGSPIISSTNVKDVVQFGWYITPASISLSHSGADLVFNIGQFDQLTIKNWFLSSYSQIEAFRFADGTVWDQTKIQSMMVSYK